MTTTVRFGVSRGGAVDYAFRSGYSVTEGRESTLLAACNAARTAIDAFDDGARRGDPFTQLCELSELEHRAVMTACATKAATPAGIAEKALLLDRIAAARNPSQPTLETFALSLAADAVALARTIAAQPPRRT